MAAVSTVINEQPGESTFDFIFHPLADERMLGEYQCREGRFIWGPKTIIEITNKRLLLRRRARCSCCSKNPYKETAVFLPNIELVRTQSEGIPGKCSNCCCLTCWRNCKKPAHQTKFVSKRKCSIFDCCKPCCPKMKCGPCCCCDLCCEDAECVKSCRERCSSCRGFPCCCRSSPERGPCCPNEAKGPCCLCQLFILPCRPRNCCDGCDCCECFESVDKPKWVEIRVHFVSDVFNFKASEANYAADLLGRAINFFKPKTMGY